MSYIPNNASVYLAAFEGALAGIAASGKFILDAVEEDYAYPAQQADAFAQAVDTAFGSTTPTNNDIGSLLGICQGVWQGRSPLSSDKSTLPSSYTGVAAAIALATKEGTEQVVAEGIDPNSTLFGGGGSGGSIAIENNGTPLGGGPFSTLNFRPGLTAASGGPGIANVTPAETVPLRAQWIDSNAQQTIAGVSPTYSPIAGCLISGFTPTTGKVLVHFTGQFKNVDGASEQTLLFGVIAVVHGAGAPSTVDYNVGPQVVPANASGNDIFQSAGVVMYGANGTQPNALTPGTSYDFYAMGASTVTNKFQYTDHSVQISVQDVN